MTNRLVAVGDDFTLPAALKVTDANLPTASKAAAVNAKLDASQKGAASGVAPLDSGSRVPEANLPAGLAAAALNATYASKYVSAGTKAATAPLLGKLKRGVEDAALLYIGDSTGNETIEHVYLEMVDLAARFPAYTVTIAFWDETSGTGYQAPVTIQTGTGARTLTVWNAAAAGKAPSYLKSFRWQAAIVDIGKVDLICLSHGHNMGDPTPNTNGEIPTRWEYLSFTEELTIQHPYAGILLESQNPTYLTGRETWQAKKAQVLQGIAAQKGYGFIDVHQAFMDTGAPQSYVKGDLIHPTTASDSPAPNGSRLWADTVGAAFVYSPDAATLPRSKSSLLDAATSLTPNPGFTDWTGSLPAGWTATNAIVSKDTTNFETGTYGMQVTADAASGTSYVELAGGADSFGMKGRLSGKTVTAAARIYVPDTYTGTPSLVILDSGGSAQQARSDVFSDARGRFFWVVATKKVVAPGNLLRINLAVRLSGTAAGSITVDRFSLVEGNLPRDVVAGTPGPAGVAGTAAGQFDYLSTFGNHPIVALIGAAQGAGVLAANGAVLTKIKPTRDMLVAVLEWQVHTTGGNYDIGIYTAAGSKLWSKGTTATPASGAVVETVSPGVALTKDTTYYLGLAFDSTTPLARGQVVGSGNILKLADGTTSAAALGSVFPLPATVTPSGGGQSNRLHWIAAREA